jgi:hypothetical protein
VEKFSIWCVNRLKTFSIFLFFYRTMNFSEMRISTTFYFITRSWN